MCYPTIDCISVAESLVSQLPDTPTNQFVHQIYGINKAAGKRYFMHRERVR
jgi:hypothetical protein